VELDEGADRVGGTGFVALRFQIERRVAAAEQQHGDALRCPGGVVGDVILSIGKLRARSVLVGEAGEGERGNLVEFSAKDEDRLVLRRADIALLSWGCLIGRLR